MYRLTSKLVIYRNIGKDSILFKLADIFQRFSTGQYVKEDLITEIYDQIHNLLDLSTRYGFDKNLWHNYLAFLLEMCIRDRDIYIRLPKKAIMFLILKVVISGTVVQWKMRWKRLLLKMVLSI